MACAPARRSDLHEQAAFTAGRPRRGRAEAPAFSALPRRLQITAAAASTTSHLHHTPGIAEHEEDTRLSIARPDIAFQRGRECGIDVSCRAGSTSGRDRAARRGGARAVPKNFVALAVSPGRARRGESLARLRPAQRTSYRDIRSGDYEPTPSRAGQGPDLPRCALSAPAGARARNALYSRIRSAAPKRRFALCHQCLA